MCFNVNTEGQMLHFFVSDLFWTKHLLFLCLLHIYYYYFLLITEVKVKSLL